MRGGCAFICTGVNAWLSTKPYLKADGGLTEVIVKGSHWPRNRCQLRARLLVKGSSSCVVFAPFPAD